MGQEGRKRKEALAAIAETFRIASIPQYYIIYPKKAYRGRK